MNNSRASGSPILVTFIAGVVCGGLTVGFAMRGRGGGEDHNRCPAPTPGLTVPATAQQGVPRQQPSAKP